MRTLAVAAPPPPPAQLAGGHPVFAVAGDVDALAASRLSAAICCAGSGRVVLDLSAAGALDAGALADLLLAARVVGIAVEVVGRPVAVGA